MYVYAYIYIHVHFLAMRLGHLWPIEIRAGDAKEDDAEEEKAAEREGPSSFQWRPGRDGYSAGRTQYMQQMCRSVKKANFMGNSAF